MSGPTGADDTVRAAPGRPFTVDVPSNQTTGFRWDVDTLPDSFEVEELPAVLAPDAQVGDGGVQRFRFVAHEAGEFAVELIHHQPWTPDVGQRRTIAVTVS